ncbi:MAG: hypothetical protein K6C30_06145 [Bacteroidaceae bacterium]|nr:hypothetical protein [Bacteroidaceae bacterium]
MDTHILQLQAPYDYIYCNGEVGKHIATLILSEIKEDGTGQQHLVTHSYPIVKYWNSPQGVVWNNAELTDCFVLCNDADKQLDIDTFLLLVSRRIAKLQPKYDEKGENFFDSHSFYGMCLMFKETLLKYGIKFKCAAENIDQEWRIEGNSCREGYYALSFFYDIYESDIVEETWEKVLKEVLERRSDWEELLDNLVKIRFVADSTFAKEQNIESL